MIFLKYKSKNSSVFFLEDLLSKLGYKLTVNKYFGKDTLNAVYDFQKKNKLVVDGIVGPKTWSKLLKKEQEIFKFNSQFLSEKDLIEFSQIFNLELAIVKAVNEVESSGKGFLVDGRPKILFEGHVFWNELVKRKINTEKYLTSNNKDVLYKAWTKKYYKGGAGEYLRLEKASKIINSEDCKQAAYCSASWGAFQIMGYHYEKLGYKSIWEFVDKMNENEGEHLKAFGLYLENFRLIQLLKQKKWAAFAKAYNGKNYAINQYDTKLEKAYEKYKNLKI
jgi:hypothetical protein